MESKEIIAKLEELFEDVLDESPIKLTESTTANDVDGWDSLNHIQLVVAIEKSYKIKFTAQEINSWQNVGDMVASIKKKL